jgi:uncharacterized protein (DUF2062 family)
MTGRLRRALDALLHLEDTPHRIALAFGIGIWIAFCPLFGIHTLMALAIAFACRLSRAALLIGAYVNNPWTLAPMYMAGTALGCAMLGVSTEGLATIEFDRHGWDFYQHLLAHLRPYLWPFVLGNSVLGVAGGLVGYLALYGFLTRRSGGAPASPPV